MEPRIKQILGVSLGASERDHRLELEIEGQRVSLQRLGCDGDLQRALTLCRKHDGRVDAIGVGGINIYLELAGRRYDLRDGRLMADAVRRSKLGDGNRVKGLLARRAIAALEAELGSLEGVETLLISAVDRFTLAQILKAAGARLHCADLLSLGLPIPLRSLEMVKLLARLFLPIIGRLPTHFFYPNQMTKTPRPSRMVARFFRSTQLIAGDFHLIHAQLPKDLRGKAILTNTTTAQDRALLQERGLSLLVSSTPCFKGRTFGTNILEALLLAFIQKPQEEILEADLEVLIQRFDLRPHIWRWGEVNYK